MATLLTKTTSEVELERIEAEINSEAFEAFYHIGQKLLGIKRGKLFEAAGFKTWGAYCASGRIDYGTSQANDYIRASELRSKLTGMPVDFSVRHMLELCKCETDNDAKRVAKKSIALAKKLGDRVTAKLIAKVRDGDDETGATSTRRDAELQSSSLEAHLKTLAGELEDWFFSLSQIDLEQWDDVNSRILTRVRRSSHKLTEFLEG